MPDSADSFAISASTAPSDVRGTTPSWTMYAALIRPTAANADLRPAQMPARSAGSTAALISVAPACLAERADGGGVPAAHRRPGRRAPR